MPDATSTPGPPRAYRFEEFVFDPRTGELVSGDRRTRLTGQLSDLLLALLERQGDLVTRDELRQRIWPADPEVDFSHALTAAINRLREALGDSARASRFIETSPRRGYRWLVPVQVDRESWPVGETTPAAPAPAEPTPGRGIRRLGWLAAALVFAVALALAAVWSPSARSVDHDAGKAALEAYAQGQLRATRRTDAVDLAEAEAYFRRAIDLDPALAVAHAGLAAVLAQRLYERGVAPATVIAEARREAEEALRLGPDLAEPYMSMGTIQFQADWDWPAAEVSFSRALEIDPGNADAMRGLARLLAARRRVDEAIVLRKRMVDQDPVSQSVRAGLALSYVYARQFDEAVRVLEPYVATWARPRVDALLAVAHAAGGHCESALSALEPAEAPRGTEPDRQVVDGVRGWVYATCGRPDDARRIAASLESEATRNGADPALLAMLHGALGERDRAFEYLARGVAERSPTAIMIDVDPMFDSLRGDPRFEPLAARVRAGGTSPRP